MLGAPATRACNEMARGREMITVQERLGQVKERQQYACKQSMLRCQNEGVPSKPPCEQQVRAGRLPQ